METILKKHALGLAAAQILGFSDEYNSEDKWYEGYELLVSIVDNEGDPEPEHVVVWEPFEHLSWEDVLNQINTEADAIYKTYKTVLGLAKAGIICTAIDGTLDSDFNTLDMEHLVEVGAKSHEAESNTGL